VSAVVAEPPAPVALSREQAIQQAAEVSKALTGLVDETGAKEVQARFNALKADLEALDQRLLGVGRRIAGAPLVAGNVLKITDFGLARQVCFLESC
jgi:ABC-type Zn uptake system ZnuABC Zn-binding protein ZnuA